MNESILNSIKKMLGIDTAYNYFNEDLIICINTCLAELTQLGVGDAGGYMITGAEETWEDFLGYGENDTRDPRLSPIISFVHLKTKLLFDPPDTGPLNNAMTALVDELVWRINVTVDPYR